MKSLLWLALLVESKQQHKALPEYFLGHPCPFYNFPTLNVIYTE